MDENIALLRYMHVYDEYVLKHACVRHTTLHEAGHALLLKQS